METHPEPGKALSDGANMLALNKVKNLLGLGFRLFWWWRHQKMKRLAPKWQSERGL